MTLTALSQLDFATAAATFGITALTAALGAGMRTRTSPWLTAFFVCLALEYAVALAIMGWRDDLPAAAIRWLHAFNVPSAYLLGPLLYGYALALTSVSPPRVRDAWWHLLPFGATLAFSLGNALYTLDASPTGLFLYQLSYHAWLLQGVPYICLTALRTYRARAVLEQVSADEGALHLAWLRSLAAVVGVTWMLASFDRLQRIADTHDFEWLGTAIACVIMVALYLLGWFGLRQRILIPPELTDPPVRADDTAAARYERSGLDRAQCRQIAAELTRLLTNERLYADGSFDLQALSRRSGWPPNYVSQALNQGLGRNFFEFVNGFRVAAAETCLADPTDTRTILEIALACGFGSKSTFNTVFKRINGSTPGEFRRARATPATQTTSA
jgi:AraC-like DNA-binding protein